MADEFAALLADPKTLQNVSRIGTS